PGLIDMHTHLTKSEPGTSQSLAADPAENTLIAAEKLRFFVQSGITSIRDVGSANGVAFRLKDWVARGRIPGPRVFAAGDNISGRGGHAAEGYVTGAPPNRRIASGADDWREAVREQFAAGADVIKVLSHFSPEEVRAAVDEAHDLG